MSPQALRAYFYLAVAAGRALIIKDDWDGMSAAAVFAVHNIPRLYLTPELQQRLIALQSSRSNKSPPSSEAPVAMSLNSTSITFSNQGVSQRPNVTLARVLTESAFGGADVVNVRMTSFPTVTELRTESRRFVCPQQTTARLSTQFTGTRCSDSTNASTTLPLPVGRRCASGVVMAGVPLSPKEAAQLGEQPRSGSDVPVTCVTAQAWAALFDGPYPIPTGAMMDFLFKPERRFVVDALLPLLRQLPAWNRPGPRIGVHMRTFEADKDRYATCSIQ
jgi:hypothetical protein